MLLVVLLFGVVLAQTPVAAEAPRVSFWQRAVANPLRGAWQKVTKFHYEGRVRDNRNARIPFYEDILKDPHWKKLPAAMSVR